jgi:hypothetical protein
MRVRVYKNIRTGEYSILNPKTGRVMAHRSSVALTNVEFVVRAAGREATVRRRRKTVHAFAVGRLLRVKDVNDMKPLCKTRLHYDPYVAGYFFTNKGKRIDQASAAVLDHRGLFIKK